GDSAAITSEAVTPSTRLWEEGGMELSLVGADRAGWLKRLRKTLCFLLPTSGKPSCLISCSHASFDDKERYRSRHLIENAFCRLPPRYDNLAANFLSGVALVTA